MKPRLVLALGISHLDATLAELWVKWVSFLAMQEGGDSHDLTLVVMGTQHVTKDQWSCIRSAIVPTDGMFNVVGAVLEDENEKGYPISASHLFLRTMEYCEVEFPGHPVLWLEADTAPIRPTWAKEIEAEYNACGKPFMGAMEKGVDPHMPGVAVYPPNWRELSPRLANVLSAPDIPMWGPGRGQAFDTYAGIEIVPQMAVASTIQQIWRAPPFNKARLSQIKPETALFHQSKDGLLIESLAADRFPEFTEKIEGPKELLYAVRGHHLRKVVINREPYAVSFRTMRLVGGWWSVIQPRTVMEAARLERLEKKGLVERVTKQALEHEAAKYHKGRRIIHV